jgi:hypothetical protein
MDLAQMELMKKMLLYLLMTALMIMSLVIKVLGLFNFMLLGVGIVKV